MNWRRNIMILVLGLTIPILVGNKGCEKVSTFEHPVVEKGMECKDCHDDGRTPKTKPVWHDLAWTKNHGKDIQRYGFKGTKTTCTLCHTESTCTSCHRQEKPKGHTEFWRLRGHALEVGLDRSRCFACHQADACERCHAQTRPLDHNAAFAAPTNRHCLTCHVPIGSVGAQRCAVCHTGTPSHNNAPAQPANTLHTAGANCRSCHFPMRHPDNGGECTVCHARP